MNLHDEAAAAGLLRRVGILAFGDGSPDRRYHIIPRTVAVGDDADATNGVSKAVISPLASRQTQLPRKGRGTYLFEAVLTAMRSLSRSSRRRLFSSVKRRSLRSAMDCLFFLIWDGSAPPSRVMNCAILLCGTVEPTDTPRG